MIRMRTDVLGVIQRSRGMRERCTVPVGGKRLRERERRTDTVRALKQTEEIAGETETEGERDEE